jgi:UDP-2,4-diacetamido-2,4,6-trideoxy-beta-L-altropyranose hydrolase
MNEPEIFIFADASQKIGYGHLYRCNALYQYLKSIKINCEFRTSLSKKKLINLKIDSYKKAYPNPNNFTLDSKPNIVILDTYRFTNEWILFFRKLNCFVVLFDDHLTNKLKINLLINTTYLSLNQKIKNCEAENYLLGPKFAIISDFYIRSRSEYTIAKDIKNITIAFGATDIKTKIPIVLRKLISLPIENVNITILTRNKYNIEKNKKNIKINFIWLNQKDLANHLISCDLAILAGGTMIWQFACIGIPMITWPQTYQQSIHTDSWLGKRALLKINSIDDLPDSLYKINSKNLRLNLSRNSRKIIDGRGVSRVSLGILKYYKKEYEN